MPYYVITQPDELRGCYSSWDECQRLIKGAKHPKYQRVETLEDAEAILSGVGIVLSPGLHVFTDGNDKGGVGVVVAWMGEDPAADPVVVTEIGTSVGHVFFDGVIQGLGDSKEVARALDESRNVLAELAGLYLALWQAPAMTKLTIVHDYEGVAKYLRDEWKAGGVLKEIVAACRQLEQEKKVELGFRWQRGHTSHWAGRHDFAKLNARADSLATEAARRTT